MGTKKNTYIFVAIGFLVSLGLGILIGMTIRSSEVKVGVKGHSDINELSQKPLEELTAMLSKLMLPEDEFQRLEDAIFQTAKSLLTAQSQGQGVEVDESTHEKLKKLVEERYNRKYFSDMNAESMKDLSVSELAYIISFYNTEAGQKFLKLSPKIIQATMQAVQADLAQWLPKTVGEVIDSLKEKADKEENEKKENNGAKQEEGNKSNGEGANDK